MRSFLNRVKGFLASEEGPTATEYAVMLALIIIVALAAITALGEKVSSIFSNVEGALPPGTAP
jgi:pilus assembly protein Flp/PilA